MRALKISHVSMSKAMAMHIPSAYLLKPGILCFILTVSACTSHPPSKAETESNTRKAVETNTSLGLEYMHRGQNEIALGKLKKAIAQDPDYAPAHTVIAILYERIGELELAGRHYLKAYDASPENGDVNNNYGVFLCKQGESEKALKHFNTALKDPFYSTPSVALTNAGSCALGMGKFSRAETYLRKALEKNPKFPDALLTISRLYYAQDSYLKARAFLQRYEAVGKHTAESLFLGFQIEDALHNKKQSKQYNATLQTSFPSSQQAADARRISGL